MQITSSQFNLTNNIQFGTIIVPDKKVRTKILRGLNKKQLKNLKNNLMNQYNNPVDAFITEDKLGLKACLYCPYRLENFIENYHQIPFLESSKNFLYRIIKKCDDYKKQLNI